MIVFEFQYDDKLFHEGFLNYRKSLIGKLFTSNYYVFICYLICGICLAYLIHKGIYESALIVFIAILGLYLVDKFSPILIKNILEKQFKKSIYHNEFIRIVLYEDGITFTNKKVNARLSWDAFTKASRFDDGFMIFQGQNLYHYLPTSKLVQGTEEQVEKLINSKIKNYKKI